MRRTSDHRDSFAVRLEPGDLYTLAGESRWRWQHGILLDNPLAGMPNAEERCRVSMLWRILEEQPV